MSRLHRGPRSSGNALPILGLIVGLIMLALNLIMQAEAAELEVYTSRLWQEKKSRIAAPASPFTVVNG